MSKLLLSLILFGTLSTPALAAPIPAIQDCTSSAYFSDIAPGYFGAQCSNACTYDGATGTLDCGIPQSCADEEMTVSSLPNSSVISAYGSCDSMQTYCCIVDVKGANLALDEVVLTGSASVSSTLSFTDPNDDSRTLGTGLSSLRTGRILGSNARDTLTGSRTDHNLYTEILDAGNAGVDILYGLEGDDELHGGPDSDHLYGGPGDDVIYVHGAVGTRAYGGPGEDVINAGDFLGGGVIYLYGGEEDDTLTGGVGSNYIWGEGGDDTIHGGESYDILTGGYGSDTIYGDGGVDYLQGGPDNDFLFGGEGEDDLFGGTGIDFLDGGQDEDWLFGGTDADELFGGQGDDHLYGEGGDDVLDGGGHHDDLFGGTGDDVLFGGWGSDNLDGGSDRDTLIGDGGNDHLFGGDDNDVLWGGVGFDTLNGDGGNDILCETELGFSFATQNSLNGGSGWDRAWVEPFTTPFTVVHGGDGTVEMVTDGWNYSNVLSPTGFVLQGYLNPFISCSAAMAL